jgi:tetraacyldisaccharide 4'-kinase
MRAPAFWWAAPASLPAQILRPLSLVYSGIASRRMKKPGERAILPVICIGNFTAGGAGKTPTALFVAQMLDSVGESPAFLSRGYGGNLPGPVQVEMHHTALEVGDEPILLASMAPAIVARDRCSGARLAHEIGATAIIMDDGLQNPSLIKDCAISVVDGATGIGNALPLPSGPLRAPMEAQWPMVDAVLVIGAGAMGDALAEEAEQLGKRVFRASLAPDRAQAEALQGRRVLAFAGIGRPEKFFETLRSCGADVQMTRAFPDHHPYNSSDLANLKREADQHGLQVVTTEKDFVRIASTARTESWPDLMSLTVRLTLEDEPGFRNFILRRINERRLQAG